MKQYQFPLSMRQLIAEFSKLPALGEKSVIISSGVRIIAVATLLREFFSL
ncbi:MAG: hypothetical protein LBE20_00990 [Deltaproteobacteria bacterium]|jgi:hypothetical protein|nr:hypothetical protein [Deltaproteobacteria bacterium]